MADWPRYGARPAHLVVLLAGFAVAGYAFLAMVRQGEFGHIVVWFALGVIGVDLMLLPLAALADHWLLRVSRGRSFAVPFINHVRVPAIISGTLLFISLPLVLQLSAAQYRSLAGASETPYLMHWLLVTAGLFGCSALIYLIRVVRMRLTRPTRDQLGGG